MAIFKDLKQYTERGQKFTGVFYREHPKRKYGITKDRQIVLRYSISNHRYTEVFGWISENMSAPDTDNKFTPEIALHKIKAYRANAKNGNGPKSWTEEQELRLAEIKHQQEVQELAIVGREKANLLFSEYWNSHYFPHIEATKKAQS